jgi:hypothetical protein
MGKYKCVSIVVLSLVSLISCQNTSSLLDVKITNSLDVDRSFETVKIPLGEKFQSAKYVLVTKNNSQQSVLNQWVDDDGDGVFDAVLFQPELLANESAVYSIQAIDSVPNVESKVYSRFAPERTDDYAWENDRVGFRTYGPIAQQMIEEGDPGGTLSSGIDCWLKRVDYSVINKWYKKHTTGTGSYHKDTGEGYDPYHVGGSRGCGGIGVWVEDTLFVSKNFIAYNTLENGPVRTMFTLDYADWKVQENTISEQKTISLDLGSNLSHVRVKVTGADVLTIGITLHNKDGKIYADSTNGYFSYWEPMGDSELGTGIVCNPELIVGFDELITDTPDQSHILVHLKVIDGVVDYYTGFGWKKSGQFDSVEAWNTYLNDFSKKMQHPLVVEVTH